MNNCDTMKTILTNEKDERFIELVEELDKFYFERIGDELSKYDKYNEFNTPHVVLLAIESDNPIACASYRVLNASSVEFKRVYVKKEYRQMGVAFALIKELEKCVIKDNFKYSYIVTGKDNYAAIKLYEKLNYVLIENFGQFVDDDSVICMKKEF